MIVTLKKGATQVQMDHIVEVLEKRGFQIRDISGIEYGVLGDTSIIDVRDVEALVSRKSN